MVLALAGLPLERSTLTAAETKVDQALATPAAEHIPSAQLELAVQQAAANGVATILARIMAIGNDTNLAYPPTTALKLVGDEVVAARRQQVEEAVYEEEWKDVEQLVPEKSGGALTGRFVRGKVHTLVKRTKVGTKTVERLFRDRNGTETMTVPKYERSGPDLYEPNLLGFNGMALYVLAKAGVGDHFAAKQLAKALDERMTEFGISDHTFEVAWLAAGFTALGPESKYRKRADDLIAKLIDGQIREKGDPQGLWGPVCIHYPYLAKLLEVQDQLRLELEVNLPKKIEAATPQQQAGLVKQGQELRKVSGEFDRACRSVASNGMRMKKVTEPYTVTDNARVPGLPYFIYNRVVADVEATALATFALAEAKRAGMLPKETSRIAIRGKKVAVPEKTASTLKLAAEKLSQSIGSEGGCSMLTLQAVNTAFDKCRIPIHEVPFKGEHPPLFNLETAASCAHGLAALESLAVIDSDAVEPHAAERDRARKRVQAIAERWYGESAPGVRKQKPWPTVYEKFSVSQAALKESELLQLPTMESPPVEQLPWGGFAAQYSLLPAFASLFDAGDAQKVLQDGLYRRLAYRLIGLQDVNGQWQCIAHDPLSGSRDALALNAIAKRFHTSLNHTSVFNIKQDPLPFQMLLLHWRGVELQRGVVSNDSARDRGVFATLASLVLLLEGVDGPLSLDGVVLRPESTGAGEASVEAEAGKAQQPGETPALKAVTGADRPNAALAALFEGVLVAKQIKPAEAPAAGAAPDREPPAEADTTQADKEPSASKPEEKDDGLGSVDDLLETAEP